MENNIKKWGIFLVFGTWVWIVGSVSAFGEPPRPMAPDFELKALSGEAITKSSLAGKPALLMFWATWCGVCRKEMPNVKTLYEEKKGKGLQAVAIGFQDRESNIARYVENHSDTFTFPVAYDVENRISNSFFIRATPTFFLLDKEGRVALVHVGGGLLQNPAFLKFLQTL